MAKNASTNNLLKQYRQPGNKWYIFSLSLNRLWHNYAWIIWNIRHFLWFLEMLLSIQDAQDTSFCQLCLAGEHSIQNTMSESWGPWEVLNSAWGVSLLRIKINKLIILMFHRVLNTIVTFQKISYTLWNTSLIFSHSPSLLG